MRILWAFMRISKTNTNQTRILPFTHTHSTPPYPPHPETLLIISSSVRIKCFFCWSVYKCVYTSNILAKLTPISIWECYEANIQLNQPMSQSIFVRLPHYATGQTCEFLEAHVLLLYSFLSISLSLYPFDLVSLSSLWAHNEITIYLRQHTVVLNWKCS